MILDPLKTYADIRLKDRAVIALVTGLTEIPDWATRGRKIVEVPDGANVLVGMVYVGGIFRLRADATVQDHSDVDKLGRTLKAIGLTIADIANISPAQLKALFKSKYDSLS